MTTEIFVSSWARKIRIRNEKDGIVVTGEGHNPFNDDTLITPQSASGESRWMHVEFANAETEPDLLAFVEKYGPVNGTFRVGTLYPTKISQRGFKEVTVLQPIRELRQAQESIAAAARIVALLQAEASVSYEVVNPLSRSMARSLGAQGLEEDLKHRFDFITSRHIASKKTINIFVKTETLVARDLLCQFLNKFPSKLRLVKHWITELSSCDETGILPVLCYLLRHDLLSDVRTIGICERCKRLFVVRRRGAQFCSPECSQLKRSLDYYHSHKKRDG